MSLEETIKHHMARRLHRALGLLEYLGSENAYQGHETCDAWWASLITEVERRRLRVETAVAQRDDAEAIVRPLSQERAALVAELASRYPAALAMNDPDEADWWVVYVASPSGQLSWHMRPDDVAEYFGHVERVPPEDPRAQWDGHSTEEKYRRLALLTEFQARARAGHEQESCRYEWPNALPCTCGCEQEFEDPASEPALPPLTGDGAPAQDIGSSGHPEGPESRSGSQGVEVRHEDD